LPSDCTTTAGAECRIEIGGAEQHPPLQQVNHRPPEADTPPDTFFVT
jgi:hypothetical protein